MRYLSIIVLLLTLTATKAQTGIPDSTKQLLFEKEAMLFAGVPDSAVVRILTEKAFALRQCGKYTWAIRDLERAVTMVSDSGEAGWKYEALMNYYLADEHQKAENLLEKFSARQAESIGRKKEYLFLRWATFLQLKQWSKCHDEMLSFCANSPHPHLAEEIRSLPTDVLYKNSAKARRLSAFLPGAGSIYAGYRLKGITSFVINAGWATGAVFLVTHQLYVTAVVTGIMPLIKFYRGNITLSEQLTERKNIEKETALNERYYKTVEELLK